MFSTILKEVTGLFDKRALTSAFFPAMFFWGLTISLVLLWQKGWETILKDWTGEPVTGQFLLLISFFVWVALWAFLTLNFQSSLFRIYEGYWPLEFLTRLRRIAWQKRWDALDSRDKKLEALEVLLDRERRAFTSLQKRLDTLPVEEPPADIERLGGSLDLDLSAQQQKLSKLQAHIAAMKAMESRWLPFLSTAKKARPDVTADIYEQLPKLGKLVRESWLTYSKYRNLATTAAGDPWTRRGDKLNNFSGWLDTSINELWGEVQQRRLRLNHEFFLMFSPFRDEVMPTELGNVLKAAEARVRLRYQLDALLMWSRLQPLLPKEAAEPLQDAKTSLDLMLTLSSSLFIFGLPMSVWLALQATDWFVWWVPLIMLVLALMPRVMVAAAPAAIALVIALVLPVNGHPGWQAFLSKTEIVLVAFSGLSLVAWVCYQNAVQSCLAYGERIQSAFDLYRWKLLDELHLQLPPSLDEEREIWKQLGQLLYRGYEPSSDHYRYVKDEKKTKAPAPPSTRVPVPSKTLEAYELITEQDIVEVELPNAEIPANAVLSKDKLLNKRPLTVLPARKPVSFGVLKDGQEPLGAHVAVGVEVKPTDILGGKLVAGDLVDIIVTRPGTNTAKYENILVLDVSSGTAVKEGVSTEKPWPIVVLALPRAQQEDFMEKKHGRTLSLTRRI